MRLGKRGKTVNLFSNNPHSILLLGDHVYQYDLKKHTFNIATEQEGLDIIGTFLPITNYGNYTYLNDIKHIYRLDNRTNRLEVLYQCHKDTIINSVSFDEHGHFCFIIIPMKKYKLPYLPPFSRKSHRLCVTNKEKYG